MTSTVNEALEARYADDLEQRGFALVPSAFYFDEVLGDGDRDALRREFLQLETAFRDLELDPYSLGNRYRKYAQLRVERSSSDFEYGIFEPYLQTKKYNPDTGGVVRKYTLIDEALQRNQLLRRILRSDIDFMRCYRPIVDDPADLMVGLHLFRYLAYSDEPSFSSPNWLHKDDENVVFVHLVSRSANIVGGDNIIARDARSFESVARLEDTFDTLVTNHDKLHAVTPIGTTDKNDVVPARRDILLVTFQVREPA